MKKDLLLVKVDDVNNFEDSALYSFLEGQGFIDGAMNPHEECPWVQIDWTNRIMDLGYPEMLKEEHCFGDCIMDTEDFMRFFDIMAKYRDLPPMAYDRDKAILEEIEKRLSSSDEVGEYENVSEFSTCTGYADIVIAIQRNSTTGKLRYNIEVEDYEGQGFCIAADHYESIDLASIANTYLAVDDLRKGNMKERYSGIGWGRLEIMFMNLEKKSIELNMYLEYKEEYDGSGDYINFKLSESCLDEFQVFLMTAYLFLRNK